MDSLMVFSHLRWNFVYQRPQHLMSRFAEHYRIFFIEEPLFQAEAPSFEIQRIGPNIQVCTPRTPLHSAGFHDEQIPALQALIEELMVGNAVCDPLAWLYTPMALPLVSGLNARAVIYDCMDELTGFKGAPRQLVQREHALLKAANIVFTGGNSLFEAKRRRHPAVHCFPSSVDEFHFAKARVALDCAVQESMPRPRLGFFGVIDERFDAGLIERMASSHPEWQIVLAGPVVKIDPSYLPRRHNIHYVGPQAYEDLPVLLSGWDVCLLPFALNDATRFISPTKTLEYMAALKPIVSTPVNDVVTAFGDVVEIGEGDGFVGLCERALRESSELRQQRESRMSALLAKTSWEQTAAQMHRLVEAALEHVGKTAESKGRASGIGRPRRALGEYRAVVIGAGPTGLSAAYHIGESCLLLEKNATVGGWCRSIEENGFTFDYAGHIMFSNDPYVNDLYSMLLGDNVHWQNREAWIYSKGVHTRYPFQTALYGLPAEVISECILGAVEARLGATQQAARPVGGQAGTDANSCADAVNASSASLARLALSSPEQPQNFEEFIYQVWGKGIAKHFAIPYNEKLWAVPLQSMETSWLGGRVPLPNLAEMIDGALRPNLQPVGPNARFGYPLKGGFQALMDGFLPHLKGTLQLDATAVEISPGRHTVTMGSGSVHRYRHLVSTIPLPLLIKMAGHEVPLAVRNAATQLRHVSVRCVNLGIGRPRVTDKHWIYYPETSVFHRIFAQGNASPHCSPAGGFGITCEITYSPDKPLPSDGDALIDRCIADAIEVGVLRKDDVILARNMVDMPYAYVVYDHRRAANVQLIREWLREHDIVLAGRYSEWEYYNSDHAFLAGRQAAQAIQAGDAHPTYSAAADGGTPAAIGARR